MPQIHMGWGGNNSPGVLQKGPFGILKQARYCDDNDSGNGNPQNNPKPPPTRCGAAVAPACTGLFANS
eukprot:14495765-Alexandrium_andersonii.AAC.1